jgi:hypothetical protein
MSNSWIRLLQNTQEHITLAPELQANGLQLGEVAEIEEQMFNICTMFNRIPNVQFSTEPAILPNCC